MCKIRAMYSGQPPQKGMSSASCKLFQQGTMSTHCRQHSVFALSLSTQLLGWNLTKIQITCSFGKKVENKILWTLDLFPLRGVALPASTVGSEKVKFPREVRFWAHVHFAPSACTACELVSVMACAVHPVYPWWFTVFFSMCTSDHVPSALFCKRRKE